MKVEINCKDYLISIRYTDDFDIFSKYCISRGICKDHNKEGIESHKLWIDISLNGKLSVVKFPNSYTNNECFAFLMRYSNYSDDPVLLKTVYSNYLVYVGPYFEKKDIKCGYSAINNLIISKNMFDSSKGFIDIYNELLKKGYEEGFSMAALPYDFKESHCSINTAFENLFYNLVKSLYDNTGKKVVIIAHSYGNLNVLNQLNKNNKSVKDFIEHYVDIAGPLLGAPKAIQYSTVGSNEFFFKNILNLVKAEINYNSQVILSGFINSNYMLMSYYYKEALDLNDNNYKKLLEFWDMLVKNKSIESLVKFTSTLNNNNNNNLKKDFDNNIHNYNKSKTISNADMINNKFINQYNNNNSASNNDSIIKKANKRLSIKNEKNLKIILKKLDDKEHDNPEFKKNKLNNQQCKIFNILDKLNIKKSSLYKVLINDNNYNTLPLFSFSKVLLFDYEKCPIVQLDNTSFGHIRKNTKDSNPYITDCYKEDLIKYKNYYLSDYCNNGQICSYDKYDVFMDYYGKFNIDDNNLKNKISFFGTISTNNKNFKCTRKLKNPEVPMTLINNRSLYTRAAFQFNLLNNS